MQVFTLRFSDPRNQPIIQNLWRWRNSNANDGLSDRDGATAPASGEGITVGIRQSLSVTMAISETTVVESANMAIDEMHTAGEVLGRQANQQDGASDIGPPLPKTRP